ncbi:MAG TPA: phage tail assembly protein [Acetobacteraceae bacterium]|nr:phage tail assembly protein [Acetobacteraceae bacterium]
MDDEANAELPPTLDIPIEPPLKLKGAEYAVLSLREPQAIEVQKAETHLRQPSMDKMRAYQINLVAQVSGLPEPVVGCLRISTLRTAMDYLEGFIKGSRPTIPN